jgi:hypothetical protein
VIHPQFAKPIKLTMIVTNTCTLKCAHCYSNCTSQPSAQEMSTADWKAVIDHLVDNDVMHVFIEGGEAFGKPSRDGNQRAPLDFAQDVVGKPLVQDRRLLLCSMTAHRVIPLLPARQEMPPIRRVVLKLPEWAGSISAWELDIHSTHNQRLGREFGTPVAVRQCMHCQQPGGIRMAGLK